MQILWSDITPERCIFRGQSQNKSSWTTLVLFILLLNRTVAELRLRSLLCSYLWSCLLLKLFEHKSSSEMFWLQNVCFFHDFSPCSMSVISPYHLFLIEHHHQSPLSPSQYSPHIQFRLCYRKLLKSHFSIYLSSCVPLLLQTTNLKSWINCIWNHISSVNMDLTHTAHEQLV